MNMIRFLVAFGLLTALSRTEAFISLVREPYCNLLARSLEVFFSILQMNPFRSGSTLSLGQNPGIAIVPSCDGIILLSLFTAGVFMIPLQRDSRPYLLAGICLAALVGVNWLRLVALALIRSFAPEIFETVHLFVAQGVLILATLATFLFWLSRLENDAIVGSPSEMKPESD